VPRTEKKIWRKMENIYITGKAKAIGVSNYTARSLQITLDIANIPPSVNQVKCSVFGYNKKTYELCQQSGVIFEAYSPLTHGKQLNNVTVAEVAEKYNKTPAQIMLRWALQKNMVVIPKSTHQERIIENKHIFNFVISPVDMRKLDKLSD
jgi:diketogulonate reductase-like aldo/keto reductase